MHYKTQKATKNLNIPKLNNKKCLHFFHFSQSLFTFHYFFLLNQTTRAAVDKDQKQGSVECVSCFYFSIFLYSKQ